MPRINPTARTKADILGDNVSGYINWALNVGGKRRATILNELHRRYPNANRRTIESVYDHVIDARREGQRGDRIGPNDKVAAGKMPCNPHLPQQYHYRVLVTWTDARLGTSQSFTALVDSNDNLTRSEIESAAYRQAQTRMRLAMGRRGNYPAALPAQSEVAFTIEFIEKRGKC